jgi:hypothetical protein
MSFEWDAWLPVPVVDSRQDRDRGSSDRRAVIRADSRHADLHQQIENAEALLPVPACRVLEIAIDDLEGPGERHAQPAHDLRQSSPPCPRHKRGPAAAVRRADRGVLKIDPCHGDVADPLAIVALREELKAMGSAAIHVVPDDSFDDWVVRSDNGEVFGHYATREGAELVAQAIARKYGDEFVVHLPDGRTTRKNFARGWMARLLGR